MTTINLQDGNGTTIVYIDFSKAFDVVSHNKLFVRLQSYGVQGNCFCGYAVFL